MFPSCASSRTCFWLPPFAAGDGCRHRRRPAAELRRGAFTLSFDFELIWGTLDRAGPDRFAYACAIEREQIVDKLLAMLDDLEIPATWCVLGHIMLRSCRPSHGVKHPDIVRPRHSWHPDDWFVDDPCGTS